MATYIQLYRGLESYVIQHLMTMVDGDPSLTFVASSYTNPLLPGAAFLQVVFTPGSVVSLGGQMLDSVVNSYTHGGDVIIAPRRYSDSVTVDGQLKAVFDYPGYTRFEPAAGGLGWDSLITYDANNTCPDTTDVGPDYVVIRSASGDCSVVPRHVILFHELCHVVLQTLPILTSDPAFEQHTVSLENQYRASFGLVLRSDDASDAVMSVDFARRDGLCP